MRKICFTSTAHLALLDILFRVKGETCTVLFCKFTVVHFPGGDKVVKFGFHASKLKKQPFLLIISKSRGQPPLPPPFRSPCILLDIGLNLWHSLVLQSQISNFPYSLKKICLLCETISVEYLTLSLNEAPKAHHFGFLLLIQRSAVQQKSNSLPNTKNIFYCKTCVVRTIAMFIASQ